MQTIKPYYEDPYCKIYHGRFEVVAPQLEDKVDLILTDPPYGTTASKWDKPIDIPTMWSLLATFKGAPTVLFAAQPFSSELVCSNRAEFKHEWIWEKNRASNFLSAKKQPMREHEQILVFSKETVAYHPQKTKGHKPINFARRKSDSSAVYRAHKEYTNQAGATDRYPRSILKYDCVDNCSPERCHPNQKPVDLMQFLVLTYSLAGMTVLDFTMGSGSTLRAAKNVGRKSIGIEMSESDCENAAKRLAQECLEL